MSRKGQYARIGDENKLCCLFLFGLQEIGENSMLRSRGEEGSSVATHGTEQGRSKDE